MTTAVRVVCPPGAAGGSVIQVAHPQTQQMYQVPPCHREPPRGTIARRSRHLTCALPLAAPQVTVPSGVTTGMTFDVHIPDAAAAAPPPPHPPVVGTPVPPPGYAPSAPPYHAPPGYGAAPPDIRASKEAWFAHYDKDRSGTLDRQEIANALIETFRAHDPSRQMTIRQAVDACWSMFDLDLNGTISSYEFSRADGLADTIIANVQL